MWPLQPLTCVCLHVHSFGHDGRCVWLRPSRQSNHTAHACAHDNHLQLCLTLIHSQIEMHSHSKCWDVKETLIVECKGQQWWAQSISIPSCFTVFSKCIFNAQPHVCPLSRLSSPVWPFHPFWVAFEHKEPTDGCPRDQMMAILIFNWLWIYLHVKVNW